MIIDATFWVAVSFFVFIGLLLYFKIPQKVDRSLIENINKIKSDLENAEKLKDEAKNILSEYETKVSKSKDEIKNLIDKAKDQAEKTVIKTNDEFHKIIENRKKISEEKIKQMKKQAIKEVRNYSIKIAVQSVEKIIKNSIDKKKLDKIYILHRRDKKHFKNKSI